MKTRKVESWFPATQHKTFSVELKHWTHALPEEKTKHCWNLYVYIRPAHPLWDKIDPEGGYCQDAIYSMPLHGGCTWVSDGVNRQIKVGCDYLHLGDEYFEGLDKPDICLLADMQALYDYMLEQI